MTFPGWPDGAVAPGSGDALFLAWAAHAPDGIFRLDAARRYRYANPAVERLLGLSPAALLGKTGAEAGLPAPWWRAVERLGDAARAHGRPAVEALTVTTPTGPRQVAVQLIPEPGPVGSEPGLLGVIRDQTPRRRAEAAARSMARFPAANPAPVLRIGGDGALRYRNAPAATFLAALGWEEGRPLPDALLTPLRAAWPTGAPVEFDLTTPQDQTVSFLLVPLPEEGYAHLYARDITARQRTEAALGASEARYRGLFEHMTEGFALHEILTDTQGRPCDYRFLELNPTFERLTGLNAAELIGKRVLEVLPDLDPAWIARYGRVALTGESTWFEDFAAPLNRWYEGFAYRPAARQFAVIFSDITARKRTEAALRLSEERFRNVFERAPIGIALADVEGRFQQCNPAYGAMLGYPAAELDRLTLADLVHPDDRAAHRSALRRLQAGEIPGCEIEHRVVHRNGDAVWVHQVVSVVRDDRGAPAHLVALVMDVTERRRVEAARRAADRRKDAFLAILAHELRNPLAPIRHAVALLNRIGAPDPAARAARDLIDRQVSHLTRLIDDLLDISRIAGGKLTLRRERVDLAAVVQQTLAAARPELERRGHDLTVSPPPSPLYLDADPVRLAQIVQNLLSNAGKYTPPGGRIAVTVAADGPAAVVRVKDTGVGLAPAHLPHLFEPFWQAEPVSQRTHGGLGIGLALTRRLVELHGGRIEVHSAGLGQGSEFSVRLPGLTTPPAAAPRPLAPPDPGPAARARRILIVDDNRDSAESLAVLLRLMGHEVTLAQDGGAGVRQAECDRPEIILLDLGLPDMDGYAVCRALRAQPWGRALRIIAVTGWGQDSDRRQSREAGFDQHLVKPVDPEALLALLASTPVAPDAPPPSAPATGADAGEDTP